jgi:sodium-independent sulfate anion transporter 11
MIEAAKSITRRGGEELQGGARAWNDPYDETEKLRKASLPVLKAVVVDFIAVNHFDSTGLQVRCKYSFI